SVATQKRKLTQRLKVAEKVEGISALVTELRKQRGLSAAGAKGERLRWLSNLIVASGLPFDQRKWLTYVAASALACAAVIGFLSKNPLMVLPGLALGGIGLPLAYLKFVAGKRANRLGVQLPQA